MCGIAGWAGQISLLENLFLRRSKLLIRYLEFQHHRGPDARGVWSSDTSPVVLGHNRLSIIELSKSGAQPMLSLDGKWAISYNGELYNYRKLRKSLEKKFG